MATTFQTQVTGDQQAAIVLLLFVLAVRVPTASDGYWPHDDQTWKAISWVLVAAVGVAARIPPSTYSGRILELSPLIASVGAILLTDVGNLAWLAVRRHPRG